jgi:hypothetical protein
MITGEFLGGGNHTVLSLTPAEQGLKRAMFSSFPTQARVLQWFTLYTEKFRIAPQYDFTQPPHDGELLYERFRFASGAEWRSQAIEALERLTTNRASV